MHRRLWLLAGAAAALLLVAASATATTKVAGSAKGAEPAAAPFAQSWASVPRTTACRKAKAVLVFGVEQDINGFNASLTCCNQLLGGFLGAPRRASRRIRAEPEGHVGQGPRVVGLGDEDDALVHDQARTRTGTGAARRCRSRTRTSSTRAEDRRPARTTSQAGPDTATQITGYTHKGQKQITFQWKKTGCTADFPCGPYANWQAIFFGGAGSTRRRRSPARTSTRSGRTASAVTTASPSPTARSTYNYTKGQGTTLKKNPFLYGRKARLEEVDFKIITDTNTEVQAMRGGEVDAINPTFGINLLPLKSQPGDHVQPDPGLLFQEHIDIQYGKGASPLLRAPWMRKAIMMGIDRQSIIKTVYGDLAGNTSPLNSLVYYQSDAAYKPDFAEVELQPGEGPRPPEGALLRWADVPVAVQRRLLDVRRLPGEVPLHVDGVERDAHDAGGDRQGRS